MLCLTRALLGPAAVSGLFEFAAEAGVSLWLVCRQPQLGPAQQVVLVGRSAPKRVGKLASMLRSMTRITVTMDDRLAEAVRTTAGDNVSGWLAKLVRTELLRRAVAAEIACDQQHPDYLDWRADRLDEIDGTEA
jgi:hypothetical protein